MNSGRVSACNSGSTLNRGTRNPRASDSATAVLPTHGGPETAVAETEATHQRNTREMVYEVTPKAEKWAEDTKAALAQARTRTSKVQFTSEAAESGAVDFKALAAETRRKMQAKHEKGQQLGLGNSRKKK